MRQVRGVCVPFCFGDRAPACSPDGKTIAFIRRTREQARRAIFTVPAAGGTVRRVTRPNRAFIPESLAWSPDSTRLAFHTLEGVNYVVPARGGEPVKAFPASTTGPFFFDHAARWSSDGSRLAIVRRGKARTTATGHRLGAVSFGSRRRTDPAPHSSAAGRLPPSG
jgi:Tol biopolymer transport system component